MISLETREIIKAALGKIKADIILRGGKIVNVYTREIIENDVVITSNKIIHVGEETEVFEGEHTSVKNIEGHFVCPGLIDSHIHIESSMLTITEFSKAIIPHGTTTVVIDPHELTNITGIPGLEILIDEATKSPITYLIEAPSCVPSLPGFETSGAEINDADIGELMQRKDIFALAEMMNYPGVIMRDSEVLAKIDYAKKAGKLIEGHAPLLSGKELQAYIASGISSDHETTTAEEALEKLRLGMKIQIREGSFAKDLERVLSKLKDLTIDTRNLLISTDDRNPVDLQEKGHLDYTYRLMMKLGINPLEAIQMLTINPATHLGLQDKIGGISPGKNADIIVVNNLEDFEVSLTIAKGNILYEKGVLQYKSDKMFYPQFILDTVRNLEIPTTQYLQVKSEIEGKVKVRVIRLKEHSLITESLEAFLDVKDSFLEPDIENDILPVVILNRHTSENNIGKGFMTGLGLKNAALASTIAHDCHQLICVGTDYDLMVKAISKIKESKGGQVLVTPNNIVLLPLEFAGIMTTLSLEETVEKHKILQSSLKDVETKLSDPFMALAFIALPVIPHLKITDLGLVDVDTLKIVDLIIKE